MKKNILFAALLLLSFPAFADVVSREQAEAVAGRALGSSSVEYVWSGRDGLNYGDVPPAFYVFNGEDGWAVISADDCSVPVLMHGRGVFDPEHMPDNMRSLLKEIECAIFAARSAGLTQVPEVRMAWSEMEKKAGSSPVEQLLETASWNQGSPYNTYCPMDGEARSVTGCVATAMAILMRYYGWPETGKGTIPAYTTSTKKIVVDAKAIGGFEYDWDNMPLKYSGSSTDAQKEAVARLMEHCGAMVRMDYGADGSGAYSSAVIPAMRDYMSYSSYAKELDRDAYSSMEWFRMIKEEIDAGHPVIYGGQDNAGNGGHQFVCDGYNSNNEVHINWGWGGAYNAWYAVCCLGPASGYTFSTWDSAMFGLVPDYGTDQPKPVIKVSGGQGISLEDGSVMSRSFSLKLLSFSCGTEYSGEFKAALLDKYGAVREFVSEGQSVSLSASTAAEALEFECTVSGDVHIGDYVSVMCSYSSGRWEPVRMSGGAPVRLSAVDITAIDIPSSVSAGYVFYPSLLAGRKNVQGVSWYEDGVKVTSEFLKLTAGTHTFKAVVTYSDSSTETIVKKVSVQ